MEGRKMFLEASLEDVETGEHYVDSTALFINMKPQNVIPNMVQEGSKPLGDLDMGPTDVTQWREKP
jgi:hypothetical protein